MEYQLVWHYDVLQSAEWNFSPHKPIGLSLLLPFTWSRRTACFLGSGFPMKQPSVPWQLLPHPWLTIKVSRKRMSRVDSFVSCTWTWYLPAIPKGLIIIIIFDIGRLAAVLAIAMSSPLQKHAYRLAIGFRVVWSVNTAVAPTGAATI